MTPSQNPADRSKLPPMSGSVAAWTVFETHGSQFYTNQGTIISWDDAQPDNSGNPARYAAGKETYMLLGFRQISGTPGRMFNGHSTPADKPYGWTPRQCPGDTSGTGVSGFAIDYWGDSRGLHYVAEGEACPGRNPQGTPPMDPNGEGSHWRILSQSEVEARRGQWVWLWVHVRWGRRDVAGLSPGAVRIWVAGEDTARVDVSNINTHLYGQGMVSFWVGQYHSSGTPELEVTDVAMPHFGRTPQEAYNDSLNMAGERPPIERWDTTINVPIDPTGITDPPIPAALQWAGPPPPPPPPCDCEEQLAVVTAERDQALSERDQARADAAVKQAKIDQAIAALTG